jgi:hypothetical protein
MADYGFNTQLTPNIPQTSLADMMNLARGAQAYQQAQQLNPLQLQALQQQVEQAKQFNPLQLRQQSALTTLAEQTLNPKIEEAKATSSSATTKSQKDALDYAMQHANDAVQQLQTMVQKPDLKADDIRKYITDKVKELNGPPEAIKQALYGLPENGTPTELRAFAAKKLAATLNSQSQLEKLYPAATMTTEGGKMTPRQMGAEILTGVKPGTAVGPSIDVVPTPGFQTINGVTYFVDKNGNLHTPNSPSAMSAGQTGTPSTQAAPTTPQPSTQAQPTTQAPQPAVPTGTVRMPLVREDMAVAQSGLRQMNTQQKDRYETGQKLFADAASGNQTAADQSVIINSIKQTLSQAQSSRPGQLLRQGGKLLAGNEQLDTLLKDLAQNQLLQAKMMGGVDSVNAQNTVAVANGSADIDPKALAKIVERTDATRLATQMYNQGISSYKSKDPINSAIHADNFQQAWKSNYDPRIFMVENINNSNMTPNQKSQEIKRIIGLATPAELKQLQQKALNIRRLQTGDF